MLRNNGWTVLYHGIIGVIFMAGGYFAWRSDGLISELLLYATLLALILSFISGCLLRPVGGWAGALLSNGALLLAALVAFPVYSFYELARHAVYFYYIYHLPMPIIELFFSNMKVGPLFALTLMPYIAATLGHLLRRAYAKKRGRITAVPLALCVMLLSAGCSQNAQISDYWKKPAVEQSLSHSYELNILLVHAGNEFRTEAIPQQFKQTLYAGAVVTKSVLDELKEQQPDRYDLIYLDNELQHEEGWEEAQRWLTDYVAGGGTLYLSHEYGEAFPGEFLGISGFEAAPDGKLNFTYPEVRADLKGLQGVWESFANLYGSFQGLEAKGQIDFQHGAVPAAATALVEKDGLAYLLVHEWGDGQVIWSNRFVAPDAFITRLDLSAEDGGSYFHFGWATANMLLKSELINLTSKDKYGYSIKKAYGPYGRPGVAWQAHYEALYSFVLRDLVKWTELLQTYDQIPTYSLVRGSYNGGKWHEAIRLHQNIGTDGEPDFEGVERDSFFSSGQLLTTENDGLRFDAYPGYNSFLTPIKELYRAYPAIVPEGIQSDYELIVGSADGSIFGISQAGSNGSQVTSTRLTVKGGADTFAERNSAPAAIDWNGDGGLDLLVGGGDGRVKLYTLEGKRYVDQGFVLAGSDEIKVEGPAAAHVADWNGDGFADLLIGDSEGNVYWYAGERGEGSIAFKPQGKLPIDTGMTYAAPFATDWNNDGRLDLLVGGYEGEIRQFQQSSEGGWSDEGLLTGHNANFFGTNTINVGHYAVPIVMDWNGDGSKDMLTGHLEYGNTYSIDSDYFPYRDDLYETIRYAQKQHLSLIPHMYLHEYMSDEQEKREMAAHKEAFLKLGIPWDQDMGVNHHTWRINENALQTFANQKETGIWWNFGFNPPQVPSAPRDGKEFLMVMPFMLPGTEPGGGAGSDAAMKTAGGKTAEEGPFLLFSPAPHATRFSKAWDELAKYDIPLIQFEHVEHGMKPFSAVYDNLMRQIKRIDTFRKKHNYSAMTEDQIARSLLNTFYAELAVQWEGDKLIIRVNDDAVPEQVKEYADTLGVRVELGEKYSGWGVKTSSSFSWQGDGAYYIGLDKELTSVEWSEQSDEDSFIRIIRSNSPVAVSEDGASIKLTLAAKGMQDLKLYSPIPLRIQGKDVKVTQSGKEYTIVHYGEKLVVTLSPK